MNFLIQVLISVAISYLAYVLSPKPQAPDPGTLGDVQLPTADAGRLIIEFFGEELIEDANCGWYGDLATEPVKADGGK